MNDYTVEQIEQKAAEIWAADFFYDKEQKMERLEKPTIEVSKAPDCVRITVARMYGAPGLTFAHMKALADFFGTDKVNDEDQFSESGCETCDYGSRYGFTLTVRA